MNLVTGATGHLGNVLVRELLSKGEKVRVLLQPKGDIKSLDGLNVEKYEGDLLDQSSLNQACLGADYVYHLAGIVTITGRNAEKVELVNVEGTKKVIEACLTNKVKRLIYVGTIHAFKQPPIGQEINESLDFDPSRPQVYDRTKAKAAIAVLDAVKNRNLDAVIACPTGVIGPNDFLGSAFGSYIKQYISGKQHFYIEGAYDFVDVRDVADGFIACAHKGRRGQVYILSGEHIKIKEINDTLEQVSGVKAPLMKIPLWLAYFSAYLFSFISSLTKSEPVFTPFSIKVLQENSQISHAKATKELGFNPRDIRESLKDHVAWFRTNS